MPIYLLIDISYHKCVFLRGTTQMAIGSPVRFTGLYSGMDTEALIKQLMYAESLKLNRHQRNITRFEWQREAYRNIYTELSDFRAAQLDVLKQESMRMKSTYNAITTSVKTSDGKDSGAVTVASGSKAGKYTVEVMQLASKDSYTGKVLDKTVTDMIPNDVFTSSDPDDKVSYGFTLNGVNRTITATRADISGAAGANDGERLVNFLNEKLEQTFGSVSGGGSKITASFQPVLDAASNIVGGSVKFATSNYNNMSVSVNYNDGAAVNAYESTSVAASQTMSELFGYALGDTVELMINGSYVKFTGSSTLNSVINEINGKTGINVKMSYAENTGLKLESLDSGAAGKISVIQMSGDFSKLEIGRAHV